MSKKGLDGGGQQRTISHFFAKKPSAPAVPASLPGVLHPHPQLPHEPAITVIDDDDERPLSHLVSNKRAASAAAPGAGEDQPAVPQPKRIKTATTTAKSKAKASKEGGVSVHAGASKPMPQPAAAVQRPRDAARTLSAQRKLGAGSSSPEQPSGKAGKEAKVKYTPLEQQFVDLKAKHPDVLLIVEVGRPGPGALNPAP